MTSGTNDASAAPEHTPERYHQDGWWRDETFIGDLRRHTAADPGKVAQVGLRTADGPDETWTYAEVSEAAERYARALLGLGVQPGEFVGLHMPDLPEVLPLALACIMIGARFSPLMPAFRRRELELAARTTRMRVFITVAAIDDSRPAQTMQAIAADVPTVEHIVVLGGGGPAGTLSFDDFLAGADEQADLAGRELPADEPYLILFTSGTTGAPKGTLHSQNTLYAGIRAYSEVLGMDSSLVKITPHTNMHYVGLVQNLLTPLYLGGTAVFSAALDPDLHLGLMERHGVTFYYGAPGWLTPLVRLQQAKPRDLSRLRFVVSGSAPVPPPLVDLAREVLGVPLYSLWGMTENGPCTMSRKTDPPDWAAHSDGSPTGGMEVRIDPLADSSDGSGPLWVRGPAQCLTYYGSETAYAGYLDPDGWFDTGDLARDDGRGGIRITGRTRDTIIHSAFLVPVTDIENLILRHPKVAEVALIGVPDEAMGELVCAVAVPEGDKALDLDELLGYLRDAGVATLFLPGLLELVPSLPRTATGKVRKVELRERYADRGSQSGQAAADPAQA